MSLSIPSELGSTFHLLTAEQGSDSDAGWLTFPGPPRVFPSMVLKIGSGKSSGRKVDFFSFFQSIAMILICANLYFSVPSFVYSQTHGVADQSCAVSVASDVSFLSGLEIQVVGATLMPLTVEAPHRPVEFP